MEHAERLLIGTGLDVEQALLIAQGKMDAPSDLAPLGDALRAGWDLAAGPESA
jgi:hypothetical protein